MIFVRCLLLIVVVLAGSRAAEAIIGFGDTSTYYEDALSLYSRGEYVGAIIQLKNALKQDPNHLPARILIGRVYIALGDGETADKELRTAQEWGADSDLIVVALARAYLLQNRNSEVIEKFTPRGREPGIEAELLLLRGMAHLELGGVQDAENDFSAAADLQPHNPAPLLGLARLRVAQRSFKGAKELIARAKAMAPDDPDVWYIGGEVYRRTRDFEDALASYNKAIEIVPQHVPALVSRTAVLIELGREESAIADITLVRAIVPTHGRANYLYAMLLTRTNDPKGAEAVLREIAMRVDSQDPNVVERSRKPHFEQRRQLHPGKLR